MGNEMIIDAHAHACGEYLSVKKIIQKLDNANVNKVLLTPGQFNSRITYSLKNVAQANPFGDVVSKNNRVTSMMIRLLRAVKSIPKGNEYVYSLKCKLPERVMQCYWVTKANAARVVSDYNRMHFETIKFHQCWENFKFTDAYFVKIVEWATKHNLPVFIHVRNQIQIKELIRFIKKHQKTIFIIGHLYGLEQFIIEEKTFFQNVYFDLSNYYFVSAERTMMAYVHFGYEHLLMGSDTPYGKHSLENTIRQINELPITKEAKEGIQGKNLIRILNR